MLYFIHVQTTLAPPVMTLRQALDTFKTWSSERRQQGQAILESWNEEEARREFSDEEFDVLRALRGYNARLELSPAG